MQDSHRADLDRSRQTIRTGRGTAKFYACVFGSEVLNREGLVLDIGAGDSPFGRDRRDVVRVDPAYAEEPPTGARVVAALGQALPFSDHTFSVVLGSFVAQHVRDVEGLLSELLRVVRPDGVLALHPVWRPAAGRRAQRELGGHAQLLSSTQAVEAGSEDGAGTRRVRWKTLPTLVVRRPLHGAPGDLGRIAETIARSRALVPPAVVAVPARWGMRALVRARGTTRLTLPGNRSSRP
jgi:SAM-dependent methyltransferase